MYLIKINSTYYFNCRVPKVLKNYFSTNTIKQSLKTKCFKSAKSLALLLYNKLQKLIWMVKYKMVSKDIIDKLTQTFKSFQKNKLEDELKNLPDANKWIVQELDMYDDVISDYKQVTYSNDTTIVDEDLSSVIKSADGVKFNDEDINTLAKSIATAHIEILKETKQNFTKGICPVSPRYGCLISNT